MFGSHTAAALSLILGVLFQKSVKTEKICMPQDLLQCGPLPERMVVRSLHFSPLICMSFSALRARKGFTLIELLLVIGIIAILASIVIVAINPTKQLGDARNAQRRADVNTILNAVYQYAIDHNGTLPAGISTTTKQICATTAPQTATCLSNGFTSSINLDVLTGSYIVKLPHDPQVTATASGTNYSIVQDANGRVTVTAPGAEQSASISVQR